MLKTNQERNDLLHEIFTNATGRALDPSLDILKNFEDVCNQMSEDEALTFQMETYQKEALHSTQEEIDAEDKNPSEPMLPPRVEELKILNN